jgi:hypothetical protein
MSIFWILFILSWTSYAAFVGLAGFLLSRLRGLCLVPYLVAAAWIVIPTIIELINQNAIQSVRFLTHGLSMGAMILFLISWFTSPSLPKNIARHAWRFAGAAFLIGALWSVGGPGGFFLPLLFFPNKDLVWAHLLFACLFVAVSVTTFFLLQRIPAEEAAVREPSQIDAATPRKVIRWWSIGLKTALGLLVLFWLAQWSVPKPNGGFVNSWGVPGMNPAMLEQTEILCSGHFSPRWQPFRWCWNVELKSEAAGFSSGRTIRARRKIIPFMVDHYWKGSGPQEIDVALFEPSESFWGNSWLFPAQENLLVALKKDTTGSGAYQLVNQVNSWLVLVPDAAPAKAGDAAPEKVIEARVLEYLEKYADGSEAQRPIRLSNPLTIDSISGWGGTTEMHNLSIVAQALATVKNFHVNDEKTLALLEKLLARPESSSQNQNVGGATITMWTSGSPVHREVFLTLVKIDPVRAWKLGLDLYESKSLDAYTFESAVPEVINAKNLAAIDPAQIQKLLDSDPRLAEKLSYAFWQMKDPRAIPWLGQFLDHPDVEVEYHGMMGLYDVFGKKEKIRTPLIALFKTDPQRYLAPYKASWAQHRAEYVPAAP